MKHYDTYLDQYEEVVKDRLSRIEGQIRGISAMVTAGRECGDIITQLSAVSSAVTNVARIVLEHHIEHCVVEGIRENNEEQTLDSLKKAVNTFAKMK